MYIFKIRMKRFGVTFGDVRVLLKIYPPNDNLCRGRTYVVKSRGQEQGCQNQD